MAKQPKRAYWRRLRAGRAVFNAAAELCRVAHPKSFHQGDMACGVCFNQIALTINNPTNKKRYDGWGTYVRNSIDIYGRMPGDEGYDPRNLELNGEAYAKSNP